jgi:hypothetical protein
MPINDVVNLVQSLRLDSESINNWKNGVERALKNMFLTEPRPRANVPPASQKIWFTKRAA